MDTAWISAFSAVMGSLVGAFTSFVTTYANQRAQYKRDFLSRQMTAEQIRQGAYLELKDPVKEFGQACRKDLNRLYRAAS